ncbi:MAG: hypothetical protein AAF984_02660 [Verrucomicrobiota bacterium]
MTTETLTYPAFSLTRLLNTVFEPTGKEKICVLIDLEDPAQEIKDYAFLSNPDYSIQKYGHDVFYKGLNEEEGQAIGFESCDLFAFRISGGSNLDYDDDAYTADGRQLSLEADVYPNYDLILCVSTYSATAPLTAFAKKYGFRGATLHGLNKIILESGLAVDYNEVSANAEKLRLGMTKADKMEIDFTINDDSYTLTLELGKQEAQKSHGLCRGTKPDVANLPAGEIYFVPTGAHGAFPMKYEDGTIGLMQVEEGRIVHASLISGNLQTISDHQNKIIADPVTGELGELGFGTQILPVSGRDIQDEKVLGTVHVATGRSDHLGGSLTPDKFIDKKNATHDDILYAPHKTPEINIPQVRMFKAGDTQILTENYHPIYMQELLDA